MPTHIAQAHLKLPVALTLRKVSQDLGLEMNSLGGTPMQWVFCMLPSLASLAGPGLGNDYPVELSVMMVMS